MKLHFPASALAVSLAAALVGSTFLSGSVTAQSGGVKAFTSEYSAWLERAYVQYLNERSFIDIAGTIDSTRTLALKATAGENEPIQFEIDFKNMRLIKPEQGRLKREWAPGLDIQYRTSANMTSLKCRVYNFQVHTIIITPSHKNTLKKSDFE